MACNQLAVSTAQYLSKLTSQQFVATMEQLSKNHPHRYNYVSEPCEIRRGTVVTTSTIYFTGERYTTFSHSVTTNPASTTVDITHTMPNRWDKEPSKEQQALEAEYNQLAKTMAMLAIIAGLQKTGTVAGMKNVKGATVITLNVED